MPGVDRKYLMERLSYNEETGVFTWRPWVSAPSFNGKWAGKQAGRLAGPGRRQITIDGIPFMAARLAWLFVYGHWPIAQIDHINLNKDDNRIVNLREATNRQNAGNKPCYQNNLLGVKSVRLTPNGTYQARLCGKSLGTFLSMSEASAAYENAAQQYYGVFARA